MTKLDLVACRYWLIAGQPAESYQVGHAVVRSDGVVSTIIDDEGYAVDNVLAFDLDLEGQMIHIS